MVGSSGSRLRGQPGLLAAVAQVAEEQPRPPRCRTALAGFESGGSASPSWASRSPASARSAGESSAARSCGGRAPWPPSRSRSGMRCARSAGSRIACRVVTSSSPSACHRISRAPSVRVAGATSVGQIPRRVRPAQFLWSTRSIVRRRRAAASAPAPPPAQKASTARSSASSWPPSRSSRPSARTSAPDRASTAAAAAQRREGAARTSVPGNPDCSTACSPSRN